MVIRTRTRRGLGAPGTGFLLAALVAACLLLSSEPAHAAVLEVNSVGDAGDQSPGDGRCFTGTVLVIGDECTLRAAIQEANANDNAPIRDRIDFAVPTRGVATISPATQLDTITEPLFINGYSQEGTKLNTAATGTNAELKIQLDGSRPTSPGTPRFDGLVVTAPDSIIRGLVINNGFLRAVFFDGATQSDEGRRLLGCFIGTDVSGTQPRGNLAGVLIDDGAGNVVGGTTPAARNLISAHDDNGIFISRPANGNSVQGNLIGTDRNGGNQAGTMGNFKGIYVLGNDNTIGGTPAGANHIAFSDGRYGIQVQGIDGPNNVAVGNTILYNSIHGNREHGIELGADAIRTPNDPVANMDADRGPNRLQNYPSIGAATRQLDGMTDITGNLNSVPNTQFVVQFFSNPATDPEEGQTFLGEVVLTTNKKGNRAFFFTTNRGAVSEGQYVTATATRVATGDTSEFSRARRVERPVIEP